MEVPGSLIDCGQLTNNSDGGFTPSGGSGPGRRKKPTTTEKTLAEMESGSKIGLIGLVR